MACTAEERAAGVPARKTPRKARERRSEAKKRHTDGLRERRGMLFVADFPISREFKGHEMQDQKKKKKKKKRALWKMDVAASTCKGAPGPAQNIRTFSR